MFDDEKIKLIRTMPEGDAITMIWIQLLCLAGRINDGGAVYMGQNLAYSDEMLATILDQPLNTMRIALRTLEEFGMIYISSDGIIDITNWEKHQNVEGMEKLKQDNNDRKMLSYYRKKLKDIGIDPFREGVPTTGKEIREYYGQITSRKPHVSITQPHALEEEEEEEKNKRRVREEIDRDTELDKEQDKRSATAADSLVTLYHFYQENFGIITPYIQDDIKEYADIQSPQLVRYAMKKALDKQKPWSYAKGILKNWLTKNIKTLDQAQAEEVQFNNSRKNRGMYVEPVPEWMKHQGNNKQSSNTQVYEEIDEVELMQQLNELMGG